MTEFGRVITQNEHNLHNGNFQFDEVQGHLRAQRRPSCERQHHLRGTGHCPAREVSTTGNNKISKVPPSTSSEMDGGAFFANGFSYLNSVAADDHAFLLKVQDTVRAAAEEARFAQVVGMMREAAAVPMNTADVPGVVKLASRQFGLTDSEGEGILQHLIEGHDLSLYGLSNAVTRYSQDVSSYDRASDLEIIGYNILAMPRSVWSRLNQVSAA